MGGKMSDYNIHIHLPQDTKPQATQVESYANPMVGDILRRIKMCVDWKTLYALGPEMPQIGLAMVETDGKAKVLCKLENGKPLVGKILDEYIYLGTDNAGLIASQYLDLISTFVKQNGGSPQVLLQSKSNIVVHPLLYGKPIRTVTESAIRSAQSVEQVANLMLG